VAYNAYNIQHRWHEHDPQELVTSVEQCIEKATQAFIDQGHDISDIKAVGITNQRETTVVWDTNTGEALHNAIAWPDTRTKGMVRELKAKEGADELQNICGLPLSTYPSSVKLLWLLEHVEAVRKAYDEGRLTFGTVDTWLLYNLNGGKERNILVTDATNASRTMFMNLHTLEYDDKYNACMVMKNARWWATLGTFPRHELEYRDMTLLCWAPRCCPFLSLRETWLL
jgi:glycerol kinase